MNYFFVFIPNSAGGIRDSYRLSKYPPALVFTKNVRSRYVPSPSFFIKKTTSYNFIMTTMKSGSFDGVFVSGKKTKANIPFLRWMLSNLNENWPKCKYAVGDIRKSLKKAGVTTLPAVMYDGAWVCGVENVKSVLQEITDKQKPKNKKPPASASRDEVAFNAVSESLTSMQSSGQGRAVRFDGAYEVPQQSMTKTPDLKGPAEASTTQFSAISAKSRKSEEFTEEELEARTMLAMAAEGNAVVGGSTEHSAVHMDNSMDARNVASMNAGAVVSAQSSSVTGEFNARDGALVSTMYEDAVVGGVGANEEDFSSTAF